jgi:hypothetical protein
MSLLLFLIAALKDKDSQIGLGRKAERQKCQIMPVDFCGKFVLW